jgi:hypothetical protein
MSELLVRRSSPWTRPLTRSSRSSRSSRERARAASAQRRAVPHGMRSARPMRGCFVAAFVCLAVLEASSHAHGDDRAYVPASDDALRSQIADALDALDPPPADRNGAAVARAARLLSDLIAADGTALIAVGALGSGSFADLRAALRPGGREGRAAVASSTRRYLRARDLAEHCLIVGPAAVRAAYRASIDAWVRELWNRYETSGSVEIAAEIANRFPLATIAPLAFEVVGDSAFEDGNARAAALAYRRALIEPPVGPDAVPGFAARVVTKAVLAGRESSEFGFAATIESGIVGVRHAALDEAERRAIAALIESTASPIRGGIGAPMSGAPLEGGANRAVSLTRSGPSTWGGELPVDRLPDLPGETLTLSFTSWVWARDIETREPAAPGIGAQAFERSLAARRAVTLDFPFVPLRIGTGIWISGVSSLFELDGRPGKGAVRLEARKPDPGRVQRRDARFRERSGSPVYAVSRWTKDFDEPPVDPAGRARFHRLPEAALVASYVGDRIPLVHFYGYSVTVELALRALVAFDGTAARELWHTLPLDTAVAAARAAPARGARRAPTPADDSGYAPLVVPADFSVSSPPWVARGRAIVSGWAEEGFVQGLVRAYDLETGRRLWQTHIASTNVEATLFGEIAREPFASFVLPHGDDIIVATSLGAVVALESSSGRIHWVTTYDTVPAEPSTGPIPEMRETVWSAGPPILVGNALIVTPTDSRLLIAIDAGEGPEGRAGAGRILWTYDNSDSDLRDLLGYHDGRLWFTGPAGVAALEIRSLSWAGTLRDSTEPRRALSRGWRRGSIEAAGALSSAGVVACDASGLWLVDFDLRGKRPLVRGSVAAAPRGSFAGRVALQGDLVTVTSNDLFSAFARDPALDGSVEEGAPAEVDR